MSVIKLADIATAPPANLSKRKAKKEVVKMANEIGELAVKLNAEKKNSLLVVLQGMDSSGKDGTTKNVFGATTPLVVDAFSFKKPTDEEFAHDFLWRCHKIVPAKGQIQIFNRSHYEDILIQKVHNWIDDDKRALRMEAINAFEKLLTFDNNTTVLKFYLHLSKERQEEKLQERIDIPEKQWKHNDGDWEERKHWDKYMEAYEYALNQSAIPWYVVPADSRWYRNYFVAQVILDTLRKLDPQFPFIETNA